MYWDSDNLCCKFLEMCVSQQDDGMLLIVMVVMENPNAVNFKFFDTGRIRLKQTSIINNHDGAPLLHLHCILVVYSLYNLNFRDKMFFVNESTLQALGIKEKGGSQLIETQQELESFLQKLSELLQYDCNHCLDHPNITPGVGGNVFTSSSLKTSSMRVPTGSTPTSSTAQPLNSAYSPKTANFQRSLSQYPRGFICSGGSCCNTIKGLAGLGESCALVGKIGNDPLGVLYRNHLTKRQVFPLMSMSPLTRTGEVICLITPDGQRTMRAFLGSSLEMTADDLVPTDFAGIKLLHVEGYAIYNQPLTLKAIQLAKSVGAQVSFDLGSFELARGFKPLILEYLANYVDIVFCNAEEARELLGYEDAEAAVDYLASFCRVAIVMMGRDGCWVKEGQSSGKSSSRKGDKYRHNLLEEDVVEHPLDTTGAGDLFAAGFLYGYLQGYSIEQCARLGSLNAREVVQVMGAEVPADKFKEIKGGVNKDFRLRSSSLHIEPQGKPIRGKKEICSSNGSSYTGSFEEFKHQKIGAVNLEFEIAFEHDEYDELEPEDGDNYSEPEENDLSLDDSYYSSSPTKKHRSVEGMFALDE